MPLELVIVDKVTGQAASIDPDSGGIILAARALGYDKQYRIVGQTGALAAALAANSVLFALRNSLTANPATQMQHIQQIKLMWTTITAFTAAVTAGRRLEVIKANTASGSYTGGTAVATVTKKVTASAASQIDAVSGGDARIAAAAALTAPTTIGIEAQPQAIMTLAHVGAAGAYTEKIMEFSGVNFQPIEIGVGELLLIRNPVAMDAGGTFQLGIEIDLYQN